MGLRERHLKKVAKDREEGYEGLLDAQDRREREQLADIERTLDDLRRHPEKGILAPLETHLIRAKMPGTSTLDRIEDLAVYRLMLEVEFKTRWQCFSHPTLDKAMVDLVFGLGWARVHVQVKGATLDKRGQWGPRVFQYHKELNKGFYEGKTSYLGLVLFHASYEDFDGESVLSPRMFDSTILMVSGDKVIKFFEPHGPEYGGRMWIAKKKYEDGNYGWLKGTDDIVKIFAEQLERQAERE